MHGRLPHLAKRKEPRVVSRLVKQRRETIVAAVVRILDCGRSSKFEYEASCRHGLRSGMCLDGEGWSAADAFAGEIVGEALRRLSAERPTWFQGQLEYSDTDTSRGWCARKGCEKPIPIDAGSTNGRAVLYVPSFAQRTRTPSVSAGLACAWTLSPISPRKPRARKQRWKRGRSIAIIAGGTS